MTGRFRNKIETNFAGVVVLQFWMWLLKVQMGSSTLHSGSLPGQRTIRNLQSSSLCFVKSWWESVLLQPWFVHMCSMLSISIFAVRFKSQGLSTGEAVQQSSAGCRAGRQGGP